MSQDPKEQTPLQPSAAEDDMPEADRAALLRDTLAALQDAFSQPDNGDDAGTVTKLNQEPPESVSENLELPL